jgi:LmbE family N-acetylglucosaminyl deacetylase
MLKPAIGKPGKIARRVLFLGAHSDDIEIGCGGTILRLLHQEPNCEIHWKVFSCTPIRKREAVRAAELFLAAAKTRKVVLHSYRDSYFPSLYKGLKAEFEKLKRQFVPDLILTHYRNDLHQDHRVIGELTWNTFRHHLILEYEIPKYDGDLGAPNFFVGLDRETCERKARYICQSFASQRAKQWFTEDTFLALQRLRGIESN